MVDDLVQKALARWPNVPSIAGWLKLTEQGNWLLTGPVPEGLTISNERILNFICRNYDCDAQGQYFFQNGPQKAYVELAVTPWVYRIHPLDNGRFLLVTHTGLMVIPLAAYVDELGRLYLESRLGLGLVHGSDSALLSDVLHSVDDDKMRLTAAWEIPEHPALNLPATRVTYRVAPNEQSGAVETDLLLQEVVCSKLPAQFGFVLEPEV